MDILPFEIILVLRLTLVGVMTECHYAEHIVVGGNVEYATDDLICRSTVVKSATTHLHPA